MTDCIPEYVPWDREVGSDYHYASRSSGYRRSWYPLDMGKWLWGVYEESEGMGDEYPDMTYSSLYFQIYTRIPGTVDISVGRESFSPRKTLRNTISQGFPIKIIKYLTRYPLIW